MTQENMFKIVPIVRPENKDPFVEDRLVPHRVVQLGDIEVMTAPLKISYPVNILTIGQDARLIKKGIQDRTDYAHDELKIKGLYIRLADQVFYVEPPVKKTSSLYFQNLNITSITLNLCYTGEAVFNKDTKTIDSKAISNDWKFVSEERNIRFKYRLVGEFQQETGLLRVDTFTMGLGIDLISDSDEGGRPIGTPSDNNILHDANHFKIIGYDIEGYRCNDNRWDKNEVQTHWLSFL